MSRSFVAASSDRIGITGDPAVLQFTSAFTITAWFNVQVDTGLSENIVSKRGGTGSRAWCFRVDAGLMFFTVSDGTVEPGVNGATNVGISGWHFGAAVYTPSVSIEVFLDTASDGINTVSIPASINSASGFEVTIGARPNASEFFSGYIQDVRLFPAALTLPQLMTVRSGSNPSSPAGWWLLGGTASPELDSSGNGNSGSLTGTTQGPDHPAVSTGPEPNVGELIAVGDIRYQQI